MLFWRTLLSQIPDQLLTHVPADVRLNEKHLQLFIEIVVERVALEETGNFQEHAAPGLLQTLLHLRIRRTLTAEKLQDHGHSFGGAISY